MRLTRTSIFHCTGSVFTDIFVSISCKIEALASVIYSSLVLPYYASLSTLILLRVPFRPTSIPAWQLCSGATSPSIQSWSALHSFGLFFPLWSGLGRGRLTSLLPGYRPRVWLWGLCPSWFLLDLPQLAQRRACLCGCCLWSASLDCQVVWGLGS